jgi:hypothetical protein
MNEETYSTKRDCISAWVSQQPELGELRVVRPEGA